MPDYSKTIIYKICCKDTSINDIYIGSTCNFARRKAQHKSRCNTERSNFNVYQFIREHGGWDNWDMIMIHEASVENKLQKGKLEREFIEQMKPTLNILIPTRTKKEWCEDNKENIAKYLKGYNEDNKEIISIKNTEKVTCECGAIVSRINLSTHKKTAKHTKLLQNTL